MVSTKPTTPPDTAGETARRESGESARAERLSAALRDNLKRRKAQQRARDGAEPGPGTADGKAER
jgi:hypothetical protein